MSSLVKSMIMSLVRKGLVALGTLMVSNGLVEQAEWEAQMGGLALIIGGAAWSLWLKYKAAKE